MAGPVCVRPLEDCDLETVAEIESRCSPDPWSKGLFAGELIGNTAERDWFVVLHGLASEPTVVGFAGLCYLATEAHLMKIVVDEPFRGQGLATLMMNELYALAASKQMRLLTLEVRSSNTAAIGLYQRFGMVNSGKRDRYYPDGEDALIFSDERFVDRSI